MMNESFNNIRDTRQHAQVRHDLYEIIAMTIAAMIGNCDGWDEIEDFCQSKEMWLREHMGLELEHGIPSETTFARVWGQIDPDAFRACFTQWTNRVHEKLTGEVISIGGHFTLFRYTLDETLHCGRYPAIVQRRVHFMINL